MVATLERLLTFNSHFLQIIKVPLLGDNSYQLVDINLPRVQSITLDMERSAAITSLAFCIPKPSPTPAPTPDTAPPGACSLTTVDFSKDAKGKPLSRGDYVDNEWKDFGLVLATMNGGFGNKPRLFDTANPGTTGKGDPDLGAPNYKCPGGGPGKGQGGKPGTPGENCDKQGLALIIQEKNKFMSIPDDNVDGGIIVMDFIQPGGQYVKELGLLDIDYNSKIIVEYEVSPGKIASRTIHIPMLGDNSFQVVEIDQDNVKWLKLVLDRSGAVTYISFCNH